MVKRYTPTTTGSAAIRASLASQGIKARVATQRWAYRVVSDDARTLSALVALGLAGPLGGAPVNNAGREYFAYDFGGLG